MVKHPELSSAHGYIPNPTVEGKFQSMNDNVLWSLADDCCANNINFWSFVQQYISTIARKIV